MTLLEQIEKQLSALPAEKQSEVLITLQNE